MVPYAVEHARCLPGNTCLVRKVLNAEKAKDMASLEEIQQVMKVSIADKGAKAYVFYYNAISRCSSVLIHRGHQLSQLYQVRVHEGSYRNAHLRLRKLQL